MSFFFITKKIQTYTGTFDFLKKLWYKSEVISDDKR